MTPPGLHTVYRFAGCALDYGRKLVLGADGRVIKMTGQDLHVLALLAASWPEAIEREQVYPAVFRRENSPFDRTLDQVVFRLRRCLPADEHGRPIIAASRLVGFCLVVPVQAVPREAA